MAWFPIWIWPLGVCFAAWLFRRLVQSSGLVQRSGLAQRTGLMQALGLMRRTGREPATGPLPKGGKSRGADGDGTAPVSVRLAAWALGTRASLFEGSRIEGPRSAGHTLRTLLAKLWRKASAGGAVSSMITVLERRTLGPQQQLVLVKVGSREHTILLQSPGPSLVLETRRLHPAALPRTRRRVWRRDRAPSGPRRGEPSGRIAAPEAAFSGGRSR